VSSKQIRANAKSGSFLVMKSRSGSTRMIQIDNVHSRVWGREGLAQLGSRAKGCLVGDGHRYFLLATSILHTYRPPLLLLAVFPRCELLAIFTTALYRSPCTPPCDNVSLSPLFDGEYLILYRLMLHLTFNRQHVDITRVALAKLLLPMNISFLPHWKPKFC